MKKLYFLFFSFFLLASQLPGQATWDRLSPPARPNLFKAEPGEDILSFSLGRAFGRGTLMQLKIVEDDYDISKTPFLSSVKVKLNDGALAEDAKAGSFKTNPAFNQDSIVSGDWIQLPFMRIEFIDSHDAADNSSQFQLLMYTYPDIENLDTFQLCYRVSVTGGYKKQLDDASFASPNEIQKGCLYVVEVLVEEISTGKTIVRNLAYRFFDSAGKASDEFWYYDYNGNKIKIEKTSSELSKDYEELSKAGREMFTKRIFNGDSTSEIKEIKDRNEEASNSSVMKNRRMRRSQSDKPIRSQAAPMKLSAHKAKFDESGNEQKISSRRYEYYFPKTDEESYLHGKIASVVENEKEWVVFEYRPDSEGVSRIFTTFQKSAIRDENGDGRITIEDLKNTPVIFETTRNAPWKGARHTKSKKTSSGIATYSSDSSKEGFSVSIENEKPISIDEYEFYDLDSGVTVEEITSKKYTETGDTIVTGVSGYYLDPAVSGGPAGSFDVTGELKSITVNYGGYHRFSHNGFITPEGPNYSNAPAFGVGSRYYPVRYRIVSAVSPDNHTFNLPWGTTYRANKMRAVSGVTYMDVVVELDNTGIALFEARYVYINGTFVLSSWTYKDYDTTKYPFELKGIYENSNIYKSFSSMSGENTRDMIDSDGIKYEVGYADEKANAEIYARKRGFSDAQYGSVPDIIKQYIQNWNSSCDCDDDDKLPDEESAVSYYSSSFSGSGNVQEGDELLYQSYSYKNSDDITTIDVRIDGQYTKINLPANRYEAPVYAATVLKRGYSVGKPYAVISGRSSDNYLVSVTGHGVINQRCEVNTPAETIVRIGGGNASYSLKQTYNAMGHVETLRDGFGTSRFEYTTDGRMTKMSAHGGAVRIDTGYRFDGRIIQEKNFVRINGEEHEILPKSSETQDYYENFDGGLWRTSRTFRDANGAGEILSLQSIRMTGFGGLTHMGHPVISQTISESQFEKTTTIESIDRSSAKKYKQTIEYSKNGSNLSKQKETLELSINNLPVENVTKIYDENGGQVSVEKVVTKYDNAERISEKLHYDENSGLLFKEKYFYSPSFITSLESNSGVAMSLMSCGQLEGITKINGAEMSGYRQVFYTGESTAFGKVRKMIYGTSFDSEGRVLSGREIKYKYNDMGLVTHTWGSAVFPSIYEYNDLGKCTGVYIFRIPEEEMSVFNSDEWPESMTKNHPKVSHTAWKYNDAIGEVSQKTDPMGIVFIKSVDGDHVEVTMPNGDKLIQDYQESGVRKKFTMIQGGAQAGVIDFTSDAQLRITGTSFPGGGVSYTYERIEDKTPSIEVHSDGWRLERGVDSKGNTTSLILKNPNGESVYNAVYAYDWGGKIKDLDIGEIKISYTRDYINDRLAEIDLNGLSKIKYEYGLSGKVSSIKYLSENSVLRGAIYNLLPDGRISGASIVKDAQEYAKLSYDYAENIPGITSTIMFKGENAFDQYSNESFKYDASGNMYQMRLGDGRWSGIQNNANNQITQISYASDYVYPIRGNVSPASSVNVFVDGVERDTAFDRSSGDYVSSVDGYSHSAKYSEVKAEAVEESDDGSARTMQRGKIFVPQNPQNFTYDLNGNMTSDGRWHYVWNVVNMLTEVYTSEDAALAGVPREKFEYVYDHKMLKILSRHYVYENGTWVLESTSRRFYDDRNLICEVVTYADGAKPPRINKFYYGEDAIGGMYESAGVGGVRFMDINGQKAFVYNNNVGNIETLFSAENGSSIIGEYEYGVFGKTKKIHGDIAKENPLRFSGRYYEGNLALYDYGFRHYSPLMRKWISKDPAEENAGLNLYGFVNNMPNSSIDLLGMTECDVVGKTDPEDLSTVSVTVVKAPPTHKGFKDALELIKGLDTMGSMVSLGSRNPASIASGLADSGAKNAADAIGNLMDTWDDQAKGIKWSYVGHATAKKCVSDLIFWKKWKTFEASAQTRQYTILDKEADGIKDCENKTRQNLARKMK